MNEVLYLHSAVLKKIALIEVVKMDESEGEYNKKNIVRKDGARVCSGNYYTDRRMDTVHCCSLGWTVLCLPIFFSCHLSLFVFYSSFAHWGDMMCKDKHRVVLFQSNAPPFAKTQSCLFVVIYESQTFIYSKDISYSYVC